MYYLNIFPLEEKYINNAVAGELIIDPKTGHITVCSSAGKYVSKTKELEMELNSLLSLKDKLYNEYIAISDDLEDAVRKLEFCRESIQSINASLADSKSKLITIGIEADRLLKEYDEQYKKYNKYLYSDMENFRILIKENVKKIIAVSIIQDELELLYQDVEYLRKTNNKSIERIKNLLGINK